MKVLLVIYNYKAGFPFIHDIEKNLKLQGIEVDVLDTDRLFLKKNDSTIQCLAGNRLAKKMMDLRKIGTAYKVLVLRRFLAKLKGRYDVVNVHSCDPIYIYLSKHLREVSFSFYPMIWGSDFYRASHKLREKKRAIFDNARYIIFANPVNAKDFISYYKDYAKRAIITGFGVAKFDIMRRLWKTEKTEDLKTKFKLPLDKIIVAVGYNASKGQQHEKLLNELAELPYEIKQKIFLALQMTYGYNKEYADEVEQKTIATEIEYKLFSEFLDDEETSKLRLATDVVLNAQLSDGFSSSIQEHIFARNIVVVGDWLPYKPLELAQIVYIKKPLGEFGKAVIEIIDKYHELKISVQENSDKIYKISSWSTRIKNWIQIYKGEGEQFLYKENDMHIQ